MGNECRQGAGLGKLQQIGEFDGQLAKAQELGEQLLGLIQIFPADTTG